MRIKVGSLVVLYSLVVSGAFAQPIENVSLIEVGRYQHPYVSFPDSFSAPTMSSRIDRLGRPYLYMACRDSGLVTLRITDPSAPVVVSRKPPSFFAGLKVMNLEQIGPLLYLALGDLDSGTESAGLAIMDVSDPEQPILLDQYVHAPFVHGCAIVQVHDDHAYLGAMEDGIVVLDVSVPTAISFTSTYQPDPTWPDIANYPPNARGMTIVGDVLYLAYDAGGLRSIDITDPSALSEMDRHLNPDHPILTNPAYNNVLAVGDRLYCTIDYCGMEVVDISDPADLQQVSWLNPWNCFGLSWFGSDGHTNELITAMNDSLLFVSGADSEILAYDITDPDLPVLKGGHILPNDSASTWGVDAFGDLVAANFINNHGLPLQPYDSKYGGVVLFDPQVEFATTLQEPRPASTAPWIEYDSDFGMLTVVMPGTDPYGTRVLIRDLNGRVIRTATLPTSNARQQRVVLELFDAAPGLYLIEVMSGTKRHVLKAVLAN